MQSITASLCKFGSLMPVPTEFRFFLEAICLNRSSSISLKILIPRTSSTFWDGEKIKNRKNKRKSWMDLEDLKVFSERKLNGTGMGKA